LARPGAPVMRQCPPAKSTMSSSSMTSCWPTMTLDSSVVILVRPVRSCSTTCCSVGVSMKSLVIRGQFLVRHGVEDDVDAERERALLGELAEVILVLALALPTVPVVGVVGGDDHHAAAVVMEGAHVHVHRVGAVPRSALQIGFVGAVQRVVLTLLA